MNREDAPSQEVAHAITGTLEQLKAIRTFIKAEFDLGYTDQGGKYHAGVDAGTIPGCGPKPTLFLPGAQKAIMYFNCYPTYKIRKTDLGNGHADVIVRCMLTSRGTREQAGEGVGSCSTMEKKYRWRGSERLCPTCGAPSIRKNKEKPFDFYCWAKIGGCGGKFAANNPAILSQGDGSPVENPDLYDVHNTVLKMAKKRAFVDAAITLGCLSELFTQDIEDTYTPTAVVQAATTEYIGGDKVVNGEVVEQVKEILGAEPYREPGPKPENKGLFTAANILKTQEFLAWVNAKCSKINAKWQEEWSDKAAKWMADGLAVPAKIPDVINPYQFKGHLLKWAKSTERLDPSVILENARSREAEAYLAWIFHASPEAKQAIIDEMAEYLKIQRSEVSAVVYKKFPELAPEGFAEEQAEAETTTDDDTAIGSRDDD